MKKTLSIILAAVLCLGLFAGCEKDELPETELTTFSSANGYTVSYPVTYKPTSLSGDIDFVVMDEATGTNVNILAMDKQAGVTDITKEQFAEQMKAGGMEISVSSFEQQTINELPALAVTYTYNENNVTQIIFNGSKHTYFATYTELPGTSEKIRNEMTAIINSLTE